MDAIPELAEELKALLATSEYADLEKQVVKLSIADRCRCGEDSCATFYTTPPPCGARGTGHECISLDSKVGWLVLDLVNRKIVCVEVLNNETVKQRLDTVLPLKKN